MERLKNKFLKHFGGFGIFVLKKARNNVTESEAIEELKYDCNELGKAIPCDTSW